MFSNGELKIFSAGGVARPLQEAIHIFENRVGVGCRLIPGRPEALLKAMTLNGNGDVISCGAEYIMDEAEERGTLVRDSRRSLGFRRSVIIVQHGNPLNIGSLEDLCEEGVRIGIAIDGCLKGIWDDISSKAGLTEHIRGNITERADACGSLMGLVHMDKVDAAFGWNAFKNVWPDTCDVVELPRDIQVFRSTAVQMVSYTKDEDLSRRFIDFLTSSEVRKIYSNYGWIHGG